MTQHTAFNDTRLQERISEQPEMAVALLQQILPPTSAVVVGVNRLNPTWLSWPNLRHDRVLLIDAQAERLKAVHQNLFHTRGWQSREALLDASDGTATFHAVSHAGESGLLPDSALQLLWPNIRTQQAAERPTRRLDSLLADDADWDQKNEDSTGWLIIDCLPAVRILLGAENHLQRCSLVAVRVLVGAAADAGIEGSTLAEAASLLEATGFRHALSLEETHPDIVTAVFVRDVHFAAQGNSGLVETSGPVEVSGVSEDAHQALADALAAALAEKESEAQARAEAEVARAEAEAARAEVEAARDALQSKIPELENKVAALIEERGDLTHAWENDVRAKEEAFAARDAERAATSEAMKARDQALAMLQKREAEFTALLKEKAELLDSRDEALRSLEEAVAEHAAALKAFEERIETLTRERDEAREQFAGQTERMQQLETENAEAQRRHQLMQDEMVKAEAQIELIKDLLLREQGQ